MQAADDLDPISGLSPFERLARPRLDRHAFQAVDPSAGTGRASHGYPEYRQNVPTGQTPKRGNCSEAPAQLDAILVVCQFVRCVHAAHPADRHRLTADTSDNLWTDARAVDDEPAAVVRPC